MDEEIHVLATLISILDKVFLSADKDDKRLWFPNTNGQFSIRSFYDVLIGEQAIVLAWKYYRNKLVPPRVAIFCWVARVQKSLTMDNLKKRRHIFVHKCPLCLAKEESPNHLLIHYNFSTSLGRDS